MIGPYSNLEKINQSIKLFEIKTTDEERWVLNDIFDDLNYITPSGSKISINFFMDGSTFHGEALIGSSTSCIISRKAGNDLLQVARSLHREITEKLKPKSLNNRYKDHFTLNAI